MTHNLPDAGLGARMNVWTTLAVVAAASLWASEAVAESYYLAAVNGDDNMFVALSTVKSLPNARKRAWIVKVSDAASPAYRMALEEYDCSEETDRNLSLVEYNDKGDVLFSGDREGPVRHVVPSSMGAEALKAVCEPDTLDSRFIFNADNPLALYNLVKDVKRHSPK